MTKTRSGKTKESRTEKTMLLVESSASESETSIVPLGMIEGKPETEIEYARYVESLIERHSVHPVTNILELTVRSSEFPEMRLELPPKYKTTRVFVSPNISGIGEREDNSVIIVGEDYRFPDLKDSFDCIILSYGSFGFALTERAIHNFLSTLKDHLKPNGIIIGESYHLGGVYRDACSKSGHRNWVQFRSPVSQQLVTRLSISHLNIESGILSSSVRYAYEEVRDQKEKTKIEAYAIRVFSFPELTRSLRLAGFHRVGFYKTSSHDAPTFKTFKFAFVAEKL